MNLAKWKEETESKLAAKFEEELERKLKMYFLLSSLIASGSSYVDS